MTSRSVLTLAAAIAVAFATADALQRERDFPARRTIEPSSLSSSAASVFSSGSGVRDVRALKKRKRQTFVFGEGEEEERREREAIYRALLEKQDIHDDLEDEDPWRRSSRHRRERRNLLSLSSNSSLSSLSPLKKETQQDQEKEDERDNHDVSRSLQTIEEEEGRRGSEIKKRRKRKLFMFLNNIIQALAMTLLMGVPMLIHMLAKKITASHVEFWLYGLLFEEEGQTEFQKSVSCPLAVTVSQMDNNRKVIYVGEERTCAHISQGHTAKGNDQASSSLIEAIRITATGDRPVRFNTLVLKLNPDLQAVNPIDGMTLTFGANIVDYCARNVWPLLNLERNYTMPSAASASGKDNEEEPLGWMVMSSRLEHWNEFVIHRPYQYMFYAQTILTWYQNGQVEDRAPNEAALEICRTFRPGQGWRTGEVGYGCSSCSDLFSKYLDQRVWRDKPWRLPHEGDVNVPQQEPAEDPAITRRAYGYEVDAAGARIISAESAEKLKNGEMNWMPS